jgi:hypothetical protein
LFFNHFNQSKYPLDEKAVLRKKIIEKVHEFDDDMLVKELFIYMVKQPIDMLSIPDLPELDIERFKQVV